MSSISIKNLNLEVTPLTSTENKFLVGNLKQYEEWITSPQWISLASDHTSRKRTLFTSTESKFLALDECQKKKRFKKSAIHLNKQPLTRCRTEARNRSRSRSPRHSTCEAEDIENDSCLREDANVDGTFIMDFASAPSSNDPFRFLCAPQGAKAFGFGSSASALAPGINRFSAPLPHPFQLQQQQQQQQQSSVLFGSPPQRQIDAMYFAEPPSSQFRTRAFASPVLPTKLPEKVILKMPSYELNTIELQEKKEIEFFPLDLEGSTGFHPKSMHYIRARKLHFLNIVSMALLYSSDLKNKSNAYRIALLKQVDEVREFDPEFILKVALYARQELNIRAVSNFLLSYASICLSTRFYLEKYFDAAIVLPTDWIQVAEYFEELNDAENKVPFPAALRRVMTKTFPKFDEYQLAKYNRDKPKRKQEVEMSGGEISDDENASKPRTFTLKSLIRILHINSPVKHVMCLLGKKYPRTQEEFKASGLPGKWDVNRAGERMKLPTPETWETQISSHGNKPFVWEALIDKNKLPYMAMLRNLRNLILSGISPLHHKKVLKNIEDKKSVLKSRQLPTQFYEAYKSLCSLENLLKGDEVHKADMKQVAAWKRQKAEKFEERLKNTSPDVVKQYKAAVSNALSISALNNLDPIPGRTLVVCEITPETLPGEKIAKTKEKMYDTCLMMGLMCMKACEDSKLTVVGCSNSATVISLTDDNFLDVLMLNICRFKEMLTDFSISASAEEKSLKNLLESYLKPQTMFTLKLDHIVFLRCPSEKTSLTMKTLMNSFLVKYRQIVNPDLLYTDVNFSLSSSSFMETSLCKKDVYLCGSSSSLIKFIANRSSGGQLECVENVDMKFNLSEIPILKKPGNEISSAKSTVESTIPVPLRLPKWHTVKIFISSTFKDMLSERDLMIRYVIPELKRRAASIFIRILEIDLRWGITEADSSTKRATELCLVEAQESDLFVGFIGERYGTVYNFDMPNDPSLQWIKDCPPGLSITELEIHAAALRNPESSKNKVFFYFRDNTFLSFVPEKWTSHFESEDNDSKVKVNQLKDKIKSGGFKIFDRYPCHFTGIYENKPVLGGLDVLGSRVLEDLWKSVQDIHEADPFSDTYCEEELYQQNLINSLSLIEMKHISIQSILKQLKSEHGILVICGDGGSGKTAFCVKLLQHLSDFVVVKYFVGVSPKSTNLSYMIQNICNFLCKELSVTISIPDLPEDMVNQFPDFLVEVASNCGGKSIILLIDGLDHLELNDQALEWLPLYLPKNVKFICSASESSQAFKVLCDRQNVGDMIYFEIIPPIPQSDRELFIRSYLDFYKKTLDENVFNNHMLKIVTKKDSSNPLYLRLVCDFLRVYGSFDNLISMLQKLPSTLPLLFQEIILQMENEFGVTLVQSVFSLLCITKLGLEDNDLHHILSFILTVSNQKLVSSFSEMQEKIFTLEPENLLNQVKFCSLMHVLVTFAFGKFRQQYLTLNSTEFESAVRKFYLNKNFDENCLYLHSMLAAYYHGLCDINNNRTYKGNSGNAIRALLYHMLQGKVYKELSEMLCNHNFIEAVFRERADEQLLEYYILLLETVEKNTKTSREINCDQLYVFYDFVSRNFYITHRYPQLLMQQALNEPSSSFVKLENREFNRHVIEDLSQSQVMNYRVATLYGFVKNITASCGDKQKSIIFLGSENGYIKVLDLSTRKIVHSIKSHFSAVTCICYAGKNRVCAASADGTLSLWDSLNFTRVAVLKGHRHNVTGCCADPSGSILFSSGWDNSVRLWSLKDGREISVIDDFGCPVNCIAHHPVKQEVACGLWNGNIEIWDTISMQRKNIFTYVNGSVKSICYTPDGINILTCFIQSELSILSSEEGLKMSSLEGHILPVKSVSFYEDDASFISGSDDCTLKVWSSVPGSEFAVLEECKFCPINFMEFISENLLAVAFQNMEIWIIDFIGGKTYAKFKLTSDAVSCISKYQQMDFDDFYDTNMPIDQYIVFGTQCGKLLFGKTSDNSTSVKFEMDSKVVTILHNCYIILCGTAHGTIGLLSYTGDWLSTVLPNAHRGFITSFSLFARSDGFNFVSSSNDNVLKIWKFSKNKQDVNLEQELFNKHKDIVTCSIIRKFSNLSGEHDSNPIQNNLLTGSHDNNVILWNETSTMVFQGLQSSVLNVQCSNDYIIGCGNDGAVVIWSHNGKILTSIPKIELSSATLTFHVSEDGSNGFVVCLAFVSDDGSVKIVKPLQKKFCCSLEGHNKPITSCCVSQSGEIISCSLDGSVNLWRMPHNTDAKHSLHSGSITAMLLQKHCKFIISSDAHGNIILWDLDLTSSSFKYIEKKSFMGGFVRALSWLTSDTFVCAISQIIGSEEKYFVYKVQVKCSSGSKFSLDVKETYSFENEICCLDSCDVTDLIVVGLKSGEVCIITPESIHRNKISDDWILAIRLFQREKTSDMFCTSLVDGSVKLFSVAECRDNKVQVSPFAVYHPLKSIDDGNFFNTICCTIDRVICCGDSHGCLNIYSKHSLKFSEKIHNDSITAIAISKNYIFTSSLDKTVKVWNLSTFKQVGQFHSDVPISCVAVSKSTSDVESCDILVLGTSSGEVQLLKFHPKI